MAGNDWNVASGEAMGLGQHAFKAAYGNMKRERMVWNLPFEINYRSMNPHGWPQLVVSCYAKESSGDDCVKGYGCTHIPIKPGTNKK